MPQREPKRRNYAWHPFNHSYGPWYQLRQVPDKNISGAEVTVIPDMDRGRWFWKVRIGKKDNPRETHSGHEPTKEEAQKEARRVFDDLF